MAGFSFAIAFLILILTVWNLFRRRWAMTLFLAGLLIILAGLFGLILNNSPAGRSAALALVIVLWFIAGYLRMRSKRPASSGMTQSVSAPIQQQQQVPNQSSAESALQQLDRQARGGDAQAQFQLAALYDQGRGVAQDHAQAFVWCQKAADQGLAEAQYWLGKKYLSGEGIPSDKKKAVAYLQKAADQGVADAKDALLRLQV